MKKTKNVCKFGGTMAYSIFSRGPGWLKTLAKQNRLNLTINVLENGWIFKRVSFKFVGRVSDVIKAKRTINAYFHAQRQPWR